MHWGSGLFLLFCVLLFLPLRLQFAMEHQKSWNGTITLKFLFFHYTKHFWRLKEKQPEPRRPEAVQQKQALTSRTKSAKTAAHFWQEKPPGQDSHTRETPEKHIFFEKRRHKEHVEWSFQAHWKAVASFALQALQIVAHKLKFEQLSFHCLLGFSQPSWTAYSYGFFWTVLSVLPFDQIKEVNVEYIPDFQQQRQEINLQGIISCRFGQLILILFSLLWLVLKMTLEQNRKEQMIYEN